MKRLTIYILTIIILPLMFWAASCEATKDETRLNKIDSLQHLTDSLSTQIIAWKNIVSINHITIERLNLSIQDVTFELEAEIEQKAKYKNRLDSAIAIIKRQSDQLVNSIYNKPKP